MKIMSLVAAAGIATAAAFSIPATAQRTVMTVGVAPVGPGWVAYHDRGWHRGWDGPRYWDHPGPHRGYYAWNNGYYRNCSYRVTRHGHRRDWHCW